MLIILCDDVPGDRHKLRLYLQHLQEEKETGDEIEEYNSGESLLAAVEEGLDPDIIFLDIYMGKMSGVETATQLRTRGYAKDLIFCTTSKDNAMDGFRLKADGYLVKPYGYQDFCDAIWRCKEKLLKTAKTLDFISDRLEYKIPLTEITFLETTKKGCTVHTLKSSYFTWEKISELSNKLPSQGSFLKLSQSYTINMENIKTIATEKIVFKNSEEVMLPVHNRQNIRQAVNNFCWRELKEEYNG